MGNAAIKKLNFEDMKSVLQNRDKYVIINTLPADEQDCLIVNTTLSKNEEEIINGMLNERKRNPMGPPSTGGKTIVCYGRHANDEKAYKKAEQLVKLGFTPVYFYPAGLFEWMLLQDIYGADEFPTTRLERDIIKFRPPATIG